MTHLIQIAAEEHLADLQRTAERDRVRAAARAQVGRPRRLAAIVRRLGAIWPRSAPRRTPRPAGARNGPATPSAACRQEAGSVS